MKNRTEEILFEKVEGNAHKKAYVSKKMSEFSHISKDIIDRTKDLPSLQKYVLQLHFESTKETIKKSSLEGEELTYLLNVITIRYKEFFKSITPEKVVKVKKRRPMTLFILNDLTKTLNDSNSMEEFMSTKKDDLIKYHMTLGRYIRNTYIYGTDLMESYPNEHPDDISYEIIVRLWEILHDMNTKN